MSLPGEAHIHPEWKRIELDAASKVQMLTAALLSGILSPLKGQGCQTVCWGSGRIIHKERWVMSSEEESTVGSPGSLAHKTCFQFAGDISRGPP